MYVPATQSRRNGLTFAEVLALCGQDLVALRAVLLCWEGKRDGKRVLGLNQILLLAHCISSFLIRTHPEGRC